MKKAATFILVLALVLALTGMGMLGGCGEEAKPPTVTAVNPGSGRVGETLSVTITGTHLEEATAVSFGAGITVSSFTVNSDTQITASITVAPTASEGARNVAVTTPDGTATKAGGFTVTSALAPSVTGISPESGEQAETLDVTITGTNFVNVSDVTLGAGVTVNSFTVASDTQITASITIAPDALEATRDVSVTNPSGTGVGGGIFAVTWPAALDELIEAAEDEGVLKVFTVGTFQVEVLEAFEQGINQKYGIDIDIVGEPGPANVPQMIALLIQEYQAGEKATQDVLWGGEAHHPIAYDAGILKAYDWKELFPYIPDENVQLEGTALEIGTIIRGVVYNTNEISEDEVPHKMRDVLGKGWDLATTPYAAGFDRMADFPNWGYEGTKAFLEDLAAEGPGLIGCDGTPRVASGEFTLLILCCQMRDIRMLQAEGAPVAFALMEDMPQIGYRLVGVPVHAKHPNLAALFCGFILSAEGQRIQDDVGYTSDHRIEGTYMNKLYNDYVAQGIEFISFHPDDVILRLDQYDEWRAEFQAIVRGA